MIYYAKDLEEIYGITKGPGAIRLDEKFTEELNAKHEIQKTLNDSTSSHHLLNHTNWTEIDVFSKR
eukprot:CAMPEP_0201570970 /NCGR_PEP_ID=MMETSP0190_2-20130828/13479_1 /ASSEMBLY_ACC=CAM_ASM_000263 /TAXON_ID=37353 /ORGANISM="Rosalina sp." /LENGTH=65 /DNA_ID=CAMNT_0047995097 /DNA_START=23 /DNA_END=216 /DNA_ORIENTATION=-